MKIIHLENIKKIRGVEIRAIIGNAEFLQLLGNLENLCVFAISTISEPATSIKTGARHSYAKYLLFPVKLRRQFKTDDYDFEELTCGTVKYKDKLYVIYGVPRKGAVPRPQKESENDDEEPYYQSPQGSH